MTADDDRDQHGEKDLAEAVRAMIERHRRIYLFDGHVRGAGQRTQGADSDDPAAAPVWMSAPITKRGRPLRTANYWHAERWSDKRLKRHAANLHRLNVVLPKVGTAAGKKASLLADPAYKAVLLAVFHDPSVAPHRKRREVMKRLVRYRLRSPEQGTVSRHLLRLKRGEAI